MTKHKIDLNKSHTMAIDKIMYFLIRQDYSGKSGCVLWDDPDHDTDDQLYETTRIMVHQRNSADESLSRVESWYLLMQHDPIYRSRSDHCP